MANSPQAKKRARQNEKRFAVNKARRKQRIGSGSIARSTA